MECGYEFCGREYAYLIDLKYLDGFSAISRKSRSCFCSCSFAVVILFGLFVQVSKLHGENYS